MLNLDIAGLPGNLPEVFAQPSLLHSLAVPGGALLLLTALLWSGWIRHRALVNILALGLMLPLVQACMMTVAVHTVAGQLQLALLDLMPDLANLAG